MGCAGGSRQARVLHYQFELLQRISAGIGRHVLHRRVPRPPHAAVATTRRELQTSGNITADA
jgi:hypothetical protein